MLQEALTFLIAKRVPMGKSIQTNNLFKKS
jgi:hypothetical protein